MTHPEHREIEERLRAIDAPEPPADLARSLKTEIPERPAVVPIVGEEAPPPRRRRGLWLAAAGIAVAVVGVSIAYRVSSNPDDFVPVFVSMDGAVSREALEEANAAASDETTIVVESATSKFVRVRPKPESATGDSRAEQPSPGIESLGDLDEGEVMEPLPQIAATGEVRLDATRETTPPSALADAAPETRYEVRQQRLETPPPPSALPEGDIVVSEAPLLEESALRRRESESAAPSTGGTTEPNDAPYGDTFFKSYGVNPFIDTEDDALSTFAMDVDTASYTMARSYLDRGHLPPSEAIRVEEMVNFFDYRDAPPATGEGDFAIHVEGAPTPFMEGPAYRLLRFAVQGREIDPDERKPATLIFVVDVSGSMDRENRLGLVKRSLGLLLDQLRDGDRVGLVVYGSRGEVLLEPTGDHERIRSAIDRLTPNGSTNAEEGLVLAYELAGRHVRPDTITRIVLCSDGVANVGRTGPDSILERVSTWAGQGVELTTVGFGMDNYNDVLMEQMANRGDGHYAYVDTLDEARRVFVENLTGTLQTIAREAKIQVEFDAEAVSRYRLLGYENRAVADERFRDDSVDAGEIGAGHSVTALYEIKLRDDLRPRDELATLRLRYQPAEGEEVVETSRIARVSDLSPSWEDASRELQLAAVVAEYAEILRGSYWARGGDLTGLMARAQAVSASFPGDVDVVEFVALVGTAGRLAEE